MKTRLQLTDNSLKMQWMQNFSSF